MTELWQPSQEDLASGQESYVRYLGGLAILHEPKGDFAAGLLGVDFFEHDYEEYPEWAVAHAETLMYQGLRGVILAANPPESRSPIAQLEHNYAAAIPHIRQTVASICKLQPERLDQINPTIKIFRPMPAANQSIYKSICHSRLEKIQTEDLLEGFLPAPVFTIILDGKRTLADGKKL
ncbi:MAG: hypothetical protein ACREGA_03565 [Candidatus Saccharimonadales bacterium]